METGEPDDKIELAKEYFSQQRWEEAARELKEAISLNPNVAAWHFNLGVTLDAMSHYDEAVEAYRASLTIEDGEVQVLYHLGVDLIRTNKLASARQVLERIEKINASFEPAYCARIFVYAELGEHDKAEEVFYLARQYKDQCPTCFFNLGYSLFQRKAYARAAYCWHRTLDLEPAFPEVHRRLADLYRERGNLERARHHLAMQVRQSPQDVGAILELGTVLMELRRLDDAGARFRRARRLAPQWPVTHYCLGRWHLARGERDEARKRYRRAAKLDKSFAPARLGLAELYIRRKDTTRARKQLAQVMRQMPQEAPQLLELANLLLDCGDDVRAARCLRVLLKMKPDHAGALQNLGFIYLRRGKYRQGIHLTHRAIRHDPDRPTAVYNIALAFMRLGLRQRAMRWAQRGIVQHPHDGRFARLKFRLGTALFFRRMWKRLRLAPKRRQRMAGPR